MAYIKGTVLCSTEICKKDIDVEIDPCNTKGSIYALDQQGFTYNAETIITKDKIYKIDVYKCTPGKGCRFNILNIRNII